MEINFRPRYQSRGDITKVGSKWWTCFRPCPRCGRKYMQTNGRSFRCLEADCKYIEGNGADVTKFHFEGTLTVNSCDPSSIGHNRPVRFRG